MRPVEYREPAFIGEMWDCKWSSLGVEPRAGGVRVRKGAEVGELLRA